MDQGYREASPPNTGARPRVAREPEPEPERSPWKSGTVIAICVLLVLVLGWGAYKFLTSDGDGDGGGGGAEDPGTSEDAEGGESSEGDGGESPDGSDGAAPFETATYEGDGFSVAYPADWSEGEAGEDSQQFFNPEDETQWVRFYAGSDRGLPDTEAYLDGIWEGLPSEMTDLEKVRLEEVEIAGMSGHVLEYTGTNTDEVGAERHSIFAVVDAGDGTSFGVFISGDAEDWELSQGVYDTATASFATG